MRKLCELVPSAVLLLITAIAGGQNIPDIRDSLDPLELSDRPAPLVLVPYAVTIVIIATLIFLKYRARSRQTSAECPAARAHRRLSEIAHTEPRAFYTSLHNIFIEYLESCVLIKASRSTTPELLDQLAETQTMNPEWRSSVEVFLADCDRAKFSQSLPERAPDASAAKCHALINEVATAPLLSMPTGRRTNELV